jgi:hypothetical protein
MAGRGPGESRRPAAVTAVRNGASVAARNAEREELRGHAKGSEAGDRREALRHPAALCGLGQVGLSDGGMSAQVVDLGLDALGG